VAVLRATPEDFVVDEVPLYTPTGHGGHTFVRVEKRLRTTEEVARELARAAGVAPRDVGYAGRKDREAVARQWFSVPALDPAAALALELRGARVLEAARHPHKLRTGHLRANRFELVLREVDPETAQSAARALERLERTGFPNRFGAQRFGRDGANAELGRALLRGERPPGDRRAARFLLSALQAEVFNAALALRELPLEALEAGDVAVVHASGGLFRVEDVAREAPRALRFEVSATGPIFGERVLEPVGAPAERERAALAACGIDPDAPLRTPPGLRLPGARRALRARPEAARLERLDGALRLGVTLAPGCFVTVLVEELLGAPGPPRPLRAGPGAAPPPDA
jgi:tRNA pseudouridine13 synthase